MKTAQIIFLNGTSSSGKTSIAKALQENLSEPYMHISLDNFFHFLPESIFNPTTQKENDRLVSLIPKVVSGFHKSITGLATTGNHLIVDHVLQEEDWLKECVEVLQELDVLFVGVKCPVEIVELREKARGDRDIGTARYQMGRVHAHDLYDLVLDTSTLSIEACMNKIMEAMPKIPRPSAFQQLSARFANQ
jgi:chloramphenicol 3-O phosphotransferase